MDVADTQSSHSYFAHALAFRRLPVLGSFPARLSCQPVLIFSVLYHAPLALSLGSDFKLIGNLGGGFFSPGL